MLCVVEPPIIVACVEVLRMAAQGLQYLFCAAQFIVSGAMNLLHLSDLHFGKYYLPDAGTALLAQAALLAPDAIVISGDFTQRAKSKEFSAARVFLDQLPNVPRVVVPGNHDVPLYRVWERLLQPHTLYRRYIGGELNTVLNIKGAVIVGLDSTDPYRAIKNGRLSRDQLGFCERALASGSANDLRIVVLHHHLVPAPTFARTPPMAKAKRTLEALTELHVDLVLAGHLHRAYVGHSLDVYTGEQRDHGIIIVQCGTSTSQRGRGLEREKNSFNHINLGRDTIRITHYHYQENRGRFAPISRHTFARPNQGALKGGSSATEASI